MTEVSVDLTQHVPFQMHLLKYIHPKSILVDIKLPHIVEDHPVNGINMVGHLLYRRQIGNTSTKEHALPHHLSVVLPRHNLTKHILLSRVYPCWDWDRSTNNGLHALPCENNGLLRTSWNPRLVQHHDPGIRVMFLDVIRDVRVVSRLHT